MVDHVGSEVRQKGIWRGTLVHRRKDGSTFPASSTVVALRNRDGRVTHFVGVERDITDELQLRDQLVHSERLSAVGELVAGVAHEINNPLQTIIGCVELMIEERRHERQSRDLELVRQEATRAGQIVRNLLAFVRRELARSSRRPISTRSRAPRRSCASTTSPSATSRCSSSCTRACCRCSSTARRSSRSSSTWCSTPNTRIGDAGGIDHRSAPTPASMRTRCR